MLARLVSLSVLGLLCSCVSGPTILTSLEDLTSATERQGLSDANQNRILSITGLLPHAQVGSFYRYDKDRSPSTAIGISDDASFLIETRIPGPEELRDRGVDVDDVVDRIGKARSSARSALDRLVDLATARATLRGAEENKSDSKRLADLQDAVSKADSDYRKARADFDEDITDVGNLIKKSGFIVIRWDTSKKSESGVSALPIFSGSSSAGERSSGFAILSGLRLMTLFVGRDLYEEGFPLRRTWKIYGPDFPYIFSRKIPFIGQWAVRDYRLTTHLLQTRKVQYFQDVDLSREVSLAIKASYEQLGNLGNALAGVDALEAEYVSRSLASLSNIGSLEKARRNFYPAPLSESGREAMKELEVALKGQSSALRTMTKGDAMSEIGRLLTGMDTNSEGSTQKTPGQTLGLTNGTCLRITGHCIEEQLLESFYDDTAWSTSFTLSPSMDGWLTVYAVDVDADALRKEFEGYQATRRKWGWGLDD